MRNIKCVNHTDTHDEDLKGCTPLLQNHFTNPNFPLTMSLTSKKMLLVTVGEMILVEVGHYRSEFLHLLTLPHDIGYYILLNIA